MARQLSRVFARAAAVGVAAFALTAAYATPAYAAAATADLEIKLVGTTLAAGSDVKFSSISLINHGPDDAVGITLTFDLSALDQTKVEFVLAGCTGSPVVVCEDPNFVVKAGEDFDGALILERKAGASGDAGQLTASISHAGTDPESSNNSATAAVSLPDVSGPDLMVLAEDVYQDTDGDFGEPGPNQPIPPGAISNLWVVVDNFGDETANGVKMSITLPDGVSFTEPEPGDCTHAVGDATTVCEYGTVVLPPFPDDDSDGFFFFPVKVAADVVGPAALTGGVVTVEAMNEEQPPPSLARAQAAALPRNFIQSVPEGLLDVDPTDNTDDFSAFVAGPLPVTGVRAGLIGATGAALVVLGLAVYLVARRRRPAEAKP